MPVAELPHRDDATSVTSHITFEIAAVLESTREHRNLYPEMVEREKAIEQQVLGRRLENQPIYRFARESAERTKMTMCGTQKRIRDRARREFTHIQDLIDRRRDSLEADQQSTDSEHTHVSFAQARRFSRHTRKTTLYATAINNDSTVMVHAHLQRTGYLSMSREEPQNRPVSAEVVEIVPHELQRSIRHSRAMSTTNGSLRPLLRVETFQALSSTATTSTLRYQPRHASIQENPCASTDCTPDTPCFPHSGHWSTPPSHQTPRKSCLRNGTQSKAEEEATPATSTLTTLVPTRRSSVMTECRRNRVLSIAYPNGCTEVETLTREFSNGERRPFTAVCRWGEGIDVVHLPEEPRSLLRRLLCRKKSNPSESSG